MKKVALELIKIINQDSTKVLLYAFYLGNKNS